MAGEKRLAPAQIAGRGAAPRRSDAARLAAAGSFLARHLFALAVTALVPAVAWTIVYGVLLLWAAVADAGVGSPLTYPIGLLLLLGGSLAAGVLLFLPATVLGAWVSRRRRYPVLAQIPLAAGIFLVLCGVAGVAWVAAEGGGISAGAAAARTLTLFAFLLLPLGLYWWTAQGWSVARAGLGALARGGKRAATRAAAAGKGLLTRLRQAAEQRPRS